MKELIAIQTQLKAPKSQYNSFGKYHYRNCEDILESLKPLLLKHNCTLVINDTIDMIGNRFYIKATATISNGKDVVSVTAYAREEESKKGMDGSQVTGAASSYARKYALNGLFLIDDTKDSDATNKGESKPQILSDAQFNKAVERLKSGEDIWAKLEAYELTPPQQETLSLIKNKAL
jgi:hypothetical protein